MGVGTGLVFLCNASQVALSGELTQRLSETWFITDLANNLAEGEFGNTSDVIRRSKLVRENRKSCISTAACGSLSSMCSRTRTLTSTTSEAQLDSPLSYGWLLSRLKPECLLQTSSVVKKRRHSFQIYI